MTVAPEGERNPRLSRNGLGALRRAAGFRGAQAAATALGISMTHLYDIENGRALMGPGLLERMAELYQRPAEELRELSRRARLELLQRLTRLVEDPPLTS